MTPRVRNVVRYPDSGISTGEEVRGNCYGTPDPEVFYDPLRFSDASKFCADCPVKMRCREAFVGDPFAFAGGLTPEYRRTWAAQKKIEMRLPVEVTMDRQINNLGRPFGRVTDAQRAEVCRLFDEGWGERRISKQVGIVRSTVHGILKKAGRSRTVEEQRELSRRNNPQNGKERREHGDTTRALVLGLFADGHTPKEVSALSGVGLNQVYRIRRGG